MALGADGAGAIDVTLRRLIEPPEGARTEQLDIHFDESAQLATTRGDIEDVARAFGFDPYNCAPCEVELETVKAVALAHHILGLKTEQFRETGLMLAQRLDTWREFDAARRLGAGTSELQRILLGGLFNEVPK